MKKVAMVSKSGKVRIKVNNADVQRKLNAGWTKEDQEPKIQSNSDTKKSENKSTEQES